MTYSWDTTTFELTEARLELKNGLRFLIQRSRHGDWYMIEDESRGTFFRIGPAEYTFLSMLDGETTMATAMAQTCSLMGASALTENEAIQLCKWLIESGLAKTDASISAQRIEGQREKTSRQKTIQKLNPISIRVPLWNPDKLVTHATHLFGWLFSWPFAMIWMFVCTYAFIGVSMDWDRLFQSGVQVFSRNGLLWMAATWLLLKLVHELAHAVACKKFGGKTGHCGILLLLLIPLPYVDVTSSWRFTNKYQRILVSAAGMLAEIFIAAIAAIIWCKSGPGVVSFYASNVLVAASLHTLLFNANPLLKFDGYHMLADWLEIPNLASHGQRYIMGLCRKWFLGQPAEAVRYAGLHGQFIRVYGVAALIWKVTLCLVLSIAAANLFHGIGLLIALMAGILWLAMPVYKFANYMIRGNEFEQPDRKRFSRVFGSVSAVAVITLLGVPAPSVITAPLVVEYEDLSIVRNESSGFVESIAIERDQMVDKGDLLLVLRNQELTTRQISIELKLREARIRANAQQTTGSIGALQIEMESVGALEKQLVELTELKKGLEIRAPIAGRVIVENLDSLTGSFVESGTELLSIGNESHKGAIVLISQDDVRHLSKITNRPVDVRIWGRAAVEEAVLTSVDPRGQHDLPHFAFAGMYGGPLNVASRSQLEDSSEATEDNLMLIDSRVKARLLFDPSTSQRLQSGQTGIVHLRGRSEKLGGYLVNQFRRWIGRNIISSHGL